MDHGDKKMAPDGGPAVTRPPGAAGRAAGLLEEGRPLEALACVPRPAYFFGAGAVAGAVGKTVVAPLDRVKVPAPAPAPRPAPGAPPSAAAADRRTAGRCCCR